MDGIIVINKEKGYTSNDVVQIVKKIFKEKVGHTGTLDPMATGVLPLLVGKGTLLSKYLVNHDKTYIATLKLGEKKNTGDIEGETIEVKNVSQDKLEKETIINALNEFKGEQSQVPPIYSAIKVNGRKLYEYARSGEKVDIPARKILIYDIKLLDIDKSEEKVKFEVSCSKGTYIRTLCEDIAEKLGTVGYMSDLQRTKVGNFNLNNSSTINEIKENKDYNFIAIEDFFRENNKIILDQNELIKFLNGVKLSAKNEDGVYKIYNDSNFIGIGIIKDYK
ncbi:MAG: tRNA pseudouridine(55) synthase TruB, partial [Clostridia bacterium]|nr:tRNA pseudouridine(55) synthase TruB [Clostridia bacterium]